MTTLTQLCGQPLVHALGWTLLHLCWQGTAIAGLLWCVLAALGGRSSRARYAAACLALGMMVALPLATFAHLASAEYRLRAALDGPAVAIDPGMVLRVSAGEMSTPWPVRIAVALDHALPWVLVAWFAGVILFVVRLNVGLMVARRMRSVATTAVPAELQQAFDALRRRLGVARAVRLMHSALVQAPTVIGWLRPVVLVPASCLTGLSTMQIEAILAHELAHIRRHDYLVSVLQSVIETLLFYHPAVWWVSKQVRRERECCCDEMAVAVGGDRLGYARALSLLEERRSYNPEFVLGANGGVLTMRIKRLLGCKEDSAVSQMAAFMVLALIVIAAGSYVVTVARAEVSALSRAARAASPMELEAATPLNTLIALPVHELQLKEPVLMAQAEAPAVSPVTVTLVASGGPVKSNGQPDMSCTYYSGPPLRGHGGTCEEDKAAAGHYSCRADDDTRLVQTQIGCEWKVMRLQELQRNSQESGASPILVAPLPPPPPPRQFVPSVPTASGGPVRLSSGVVAGMILTKVGPVYPNVAKAAHVQGTVVLHAIISKTGTVEKLEVISGNGMLVNATRDAVSRWTYKPYLLNGEPVEVETTITVNYSIPDSVVSQGQSPAGDAVDGVKQIGGGVIGPILIFHPEPEYSVEAKAAKFSGVVTVSIIVDKNGIPQNVHVTRGVGMGLDEKAVEAVKKYKFKPGTENGKPVAVYMNVEVNFQIF